MAATDKPVWLLDVDGVIGAPPHRPINDVWTYDEWERVSAYGEADEWRTIMVARPVRTFLIEVHEQGLAEIRWHTTWRHNARELGRKLGLPEFGVHVPEYAYDRWRAGRNGVWWKYQLASMVPELERRPLIWTDDHIDLNVSDARRRHLSRLGGGRVLMLAPAERYGLTTPDLRRITEFIETTNRTVEKGSTNAR